MRLDDNHVPNIPNQKITIGCRNGVKPHCFVALLFGATWMRLVRKAFTVWAEEMLVVDDGKHIYPVS